MNEQLSHHRRFHILVCLVFIAAASLFSSFFKREESTTDDDNDVHQLSPTVLSSPYCDHLWKQDNFSSVENIIRRSQITFLSGNDRPRLDVLDDAGFFRDRSRLNEIRIESLLHRINRINDNDNDEIVFKVVVLGNSMTAGMLTHRITTHRPNYLSIYL